MLRTVLNQSVRSLLTHTNSASIIIPTARTKWISLEERKEVYNETPLADKKEDAYYYGSQILKAAYIMERIPQLRPVAHPIEQEFHALIHENWLFYARHQYTSFWDYWPEWQKAKKKQQATKKKLVGEAAHVWVPNKPALSEKDRLFLIKTLGKNVMTPGADYWRKNWEPQPRITQDDFDDNRYSLRRCLEDRLFLIFKNHKGQWMFPEVVRRNPLSMRDAAEKLCTDDMSAQAKIWFGSNAPLTHYVNPKNENEKTYFYHCYYLTGRPPFESVYREHGYTDHAWVTKHQLLEYEFVDNLYQQTVYDAIWGTHQHIPQP